jgi:hypothetical protein
MLAILRLYLDIFFQIYDPVYQNAADREIIQNCFLKSFFLLYHFREQ